MSVNGDEASLAPGSDSFWEPQNYKRTCKRIEDGHKLCDDMMKLVTERGEIEKNYAKSLKAWSKKWNELIEKGPEYGTAEAAWKAALVEADQRCELHLKVRDNLMNEVHAKVKQWQKDNFHKTMMHFKEKKEFDDGFRKAQKPWAKLLVKVNKAKADYHAACKTERTAQNQKLNASGDQSLSADALKKLADRVQKAEEDVAKSKERYDAALKDISDQNSKYIEDMTYVFNKCQDREGERLNFFKDTMFGMHKCLNIGADPLLAQIYREFEHTVSSADKEKDLRWWSNNHGVNMPMNWPAFEEYTEQFRDIGGRSRRGAGQPADADGTITLIKQRQVIDDLPEYDPDAKPGSRKRAAAAQPGGAAAGEQASGQQSNSVSPNRSSQHSNGHGYEDGGPEEWDEYATELVDHGEPGVPVRAIYDYEGVEADELSFKAGEAFEKLEDEDEQGWCKGRKDGKVGLYPANYVQPV